MKNLGKKLFMQNLDTYANIGKNWLNFKYLSKTRLI
jgi:hypothetical protein